MCYKCNVDTGLQRLSKQKKCNNLSVVLFYMGHMLNQ